MIEFFFWHFSHVLPIKIAPSCILVAGVISRRRVEVIDQFSWPWSDVRKQRHWVVGELIAKVWINWWEISNSVINSGGVAISIEGSSYMILFMVSPPVISPRLVSMYRRSADPILWSSMLVSEDFIDRSENTISFSARAYRGAWVAGYSKSVGVSAQLCTLT